MTRSLALATCIALCAASSALAQRGPYFGNQAPKPDKEARGGANAVVRPPGIAAGGETFATATVIPGIPYVDTGNTCGAVDDYFPACAFAGISTAPDLVYSYTPSTDQCVNIDLCDSSYDTALHVYDSTFNLIDCNDDTPDLSCGVTGLESSLGNVSLVGGQTYYIVVDGWSTRCGDYVLRIVECPPPCLLSCPPDAITEGEPACFDGYEDLTNRGCNDPPPPVFTTIPCVDGGATVCGTYGTYLGPAGEEFRDTDWYEFIIDQTKTVNFCVCGSAATRIAILDASTGCDLITVSCGVIDGTPNQDVCCTATLPPGTYWLFVATVEFSGVPCGSPYLLTLEGITCPIVPVQETTWSKMKNVYR